MGQQDEYLRNFLVVSTEKGVIALTDPLQIEIYNALSTGSKRPSDLSAMLDLPSSSLHFVLDKMTDSGVVVRYKPDPEKKVVYYANLAYKIAGSFEPEQSAVEEAERTFSNPGEYYDGMSSVANMLDLYTSEIGLDMDEMRASYAKALADYCHYSIGKGNLEDSILNIKKAFEDLTDFKFTVFSLNPLTLVFEGNHSMSNKLDMFTQFVIRSIEDSTGRTYAAMELDDLGTDDLARVKVTFERVEKEKEPYINRSLPQTGTSERFVMVELDGKAGIMTSDVQIDIVDAVYERPLCITDIVNKVDFPRSTITSNLLKMVEEGMVSVFYSESGSAYYGLSCSILMKKVHNVVRDKTDVSEIMERVSSKPGSFMEGYLLYTLAKLKNLGFETDYMMVVLGAKYMRAAGENSSKDFDTFFGKMSDIALAIGLYLHIVSVYPLTIGISKKDPDSEMSPAMTFVKGMAHQGLEIASNGIFVRSSEDTPEERKISFREIYPALSMTPVEGIRVEDLAEATETKKKKRTSSVKTALFNRSIKEAGKPARTVRYITGIAVLAIIASVLIFSNTGGENIADADTYAVDIAPGANIEFYDSDGMLMQTPLYIEEDRTVTFYVNGLDDYQTIGTVSGGIAYPILPDGDGFYTITAGNDMMIHTLSKVLLPETVGYTASIYCFENRTNESNAFNFNGYINASEYGTISGGLYISENGYICLRSDSRYFSINGDTEDSFFWQRLVFSANDLSWVQVMDLPENTITITLDGDYTVEDRYVTGDLKVGMFRQISGELLNDEALTLSCTNESGKAVHIALTDGKFRLYTGNENLSIQYIQGII